MDSTISNFSPETNHFFKSNPVSFCSWFFSNLRRLKTYVFKTEIQKSSRAIPGTCLPFGHSGIFCFVLPVRAKVAIRSHGYLSIRVFFWHDFALSCSPFHLFFLFIWSFHHFLCDFAIGPFDHLAHAIPQEPPLQASRLRVGRPEPRPVPSVPRPRSGWAPYVSIGRPHGRPPGTLPAAFLPRTLTRAPPLSSLRGCRLTVPNIPLKAFGV